MDDTITIPLSYNWLTSVEFHIAATEVTFLNGTQQWFYNVEKAKSAQW